MRELGHRGRHGDLVEAGLLVVDLVRLEGAGAGDVEDGGPVQMGVGDGRQDVGEAAAGRDDGDPEVPGDARVALGRVAGVHLVADVDDAELCVQGVLEDAVDVCSVQAEGDVDSGPLQGSHDEPTTGCGCHWVIRPSGRTRGWDRGHGEQGHVTGRPYRSLGCAPGDDNGRVRWMVNALFDRRRPRPVGLARRAGPSGLIHTAAETATSGSYS